MRRALPAALTAVLATAGAASAAPPKGVTYTDARGDAEPTGQAGAASQAAYDVIRVRLSPQARTKRTAGILVRIDLAAPAASTTGTAFYFRGRQGPCDITVTRTATGDGSWSDAATVDCMTNAKQGSYTFQTLASGTASGKTVTLTVPREALVDSEIGALVDDIDVGTTFGDPVTGIALPARMDSAPYSRGYLIGR